MEQRGFRGESTTSSHAGRDVDIVEAAIRMLAGCPKPLPAIDRRPSPARSVPTAMSASEREAIIAAIAAAPRLTGDGERS